MNQVGVRGVGADGGEVGWASVPVLHKVGVNKAMVGRRVLGERGQVTVLTEEVNGNVKRVHIAVWVGMELCLDSNEKKKKKKKKALTRVTTTRKRRAGPITLRERWQTGGCQACKRHSRLCGQQTCRSRSGASHHG